MKESEAIWIGNDHGGYELKRQIVEYLNGKGVLDAWLATAYEGGRHEISLGLIGEADEALCNPGGWRPAGP